MRGCNEEEKRRKEGEEGRMMGTQESRKRESKTGKKEG